MLAGRGAVTCVSTHLTVKWLCRTPQGFRALARCYVTLIIPIFFGPYYANLRLGIGTPFAVIIAIVVRPLVSLDHIKRSVPGYRGMELFKAKFDPFCGAPSHAMDWM